MTIYFPSNIKPIASGYNRSITVGYERSPLTSATYSRKVTDDRPTYVDVTFRVNADKAMTLDLFVESTLAGGRKPFIIRLPSEAGVSRQVARFTQDGVPQLRSKSGSVFTYSATLVIRKWNPLPTIELNNNLIDQAINQEWPSA